MHIISLLKNFCSQSIMVLQCESHFSSSTFSVCQSTPVLFSFTLSAVEFLHHRYILNNVFFFFFAPRLHSYLCEVSLKCGSLWRGTVQRPNLSLTWDDVDAGTSLLQASLYTTLTVGAVHLQEREKKGRGGACWGLWKFET